MMTTDQLIAASHDLFRSMTVEQRGEWIAAMAAAGWEPRPHAGSTPAMIEAARTFMHQVRDALGESPERFVIFEIEGGCACCKPGPRETVLPAGWRERAEAAGIFSVAELLAAPHGVAPEQIHQIAACDAPFDRAHLDRLRSLA